MKLILSAAKKNQKEALGAAWLNFSTVSQAKLMLSKEENKLIDGTHHNEVSEPFQ